jgi:hypothetical protein
MRRFGIWFVKEAASGLIALGVFEAARLIAAGWPPSYAALAAPYAPFWFIGFGVIAGLIWVAWPQIPRPFGRKQPTVQGSAGRVESNRPVPHRLKSLPRISASRCAASAESGDFGSLTKCGRTAAKIRGPRSHEHHRKLLGLPETRASRHLHLPARFSMTSFKLAPPSDGDGPRRRCPGEALNLDGTECRKRAFIA